MDGYSSAPRPIQAGVPQGSPPAPTLFNLFTHDIPKSAQNELYLFADDIAITHTAKNPETITRHLQNNLDQIQTWMNEWKISVNPNKTKVVFFSKARLTGPAGSIRLLNQQLPWCYSVKYLGLVFDKKLNWHETVADRIKNANRQAAALYPLICSKSKLSLKVKLLMYNIMIRSILTYGAPTWCSTKPTHLKKIQRLQNRLLRQISNSPRYLRTYIIHRQLNQPTIHEFFDKITDKYYNKVDAHSNRLITTSHVAARKVHHASPCCLKLSLQLLNRDFQTALIPKGA